MNVIGKNSLNTLCEDTKTNSTFIMTDNGFKSIARFKGIAAMILKNILVEFEGMSILDIANCIKDRHTRHYTNSTDVLDDEIDLLPSELGFGKEKNVRQDLTFEINLPDGTSGKVVMLLNFEMQNISAKTELKYDLITRGIYYGASLLRDTIAIKGKYSDIHKVYTIWFCAKPIKFEFDCMEGRNNYIHRFGFRRFYTGIPRVAPAETNADLIEAVFVELSKIRDNNIKNELATVFFNSYNIVNELETRYKVNLSKVRMGVGNMVNWEEETKKVTEFVRREGREEGRKEGRKEGIEQGRKEGLKISIINTIDICKELGMSREYTIKKLKEKNLYNKDAVKLLDKAFGPK